jgi:putative flippase GtrA
VYAQLIKYGTAGAVGTAVQYAILIGLVEAFHGDPVLASTLGAVAGAIVNYLLNYHYTFRSERPHAVSLAKYMVVSALGIALNAVVLAGATTWLGMHYVGAQVLATVIVFFMAFAVNRVWTF